MDTAMDAPMDLVTPQLDVSTFDPFNQAVTLRVPFQGQLVPIEMPLSEFHDYTTWAIKTGINYGSQFGASIICLLLMIAVTKGEKRRSPIFILNAFGLAFNALKNLVGCFYYTGPFWHPYAYLTDDYSRVSQTDIANSVAEQVMYFMLIICVELSLVLQVNVVLITVARLQKILLLGSASVVALIAIVFRFALTIVVCRATARLEDATPWAWLGLASNITLTISIGIFSIIFCAKLYFAIVQRRKLGLAAFGPMQVIYIMGLQTLIVPLILAILAYNVDVPLLSAAVPTFVILSLPLSALWAASTVENNQTTARGAQFNMMSSYGSSGSKTAPRFASFPHDASYDDGKDEKIIV